YERERDLQDIGYLFDEYISDNDERRFTEPILGGAVDWDHVSAHELGRDIGLIVGTHEERVVKDFFSHLRGSDQFGTLERMLRSGPPRWRSNEADFLKVVDAFEQGFRTGRLMETG